MDMIVNKMKSQLNSRGVDNTTQLNDIFNVSDASHLDYLNLGIRR